MKSKDKQIRTDGVIDPLIATQDGRGRGPGVGQDDIKKDLEQYAEQMTAETKNETQSVTDKILGNIRFKRDGDKGFGLSSIINYFAPPKSDDKFSPVDDNMPKAPILENFEDYAPVDIPISQQNKPNDKGYIKVKPDSSIPKASNELETVYQSKFASEYRVPWSGKKGKDDLSNFFNTYKFDQSFDKLQRKRVACPTEWEAAKI